MLKQELIDEIQKTEYRQICRKLCDNYSDDLYQELVLTLLEYDPKKLEKIPNLQQAKYFIVGIICNMAHSSTSPFHKKYRKKEYPTEIEISDGDVYDYDEDADFEYHYKTATETLDGLYWFDRELFKLYVEHGSLRNVQKATGINRGFVYRSVNKTIDKIKNKAKQVRILLITKPTDDALKYHRQLTPHRRLVDQYNEFSVTQMTGKILDNDKVIEASVDDLTDEALKNFDIVYYLRQISFNEGKVKPTIDRLHGLGLKVVFDIDDYWVLNSAHPMYSKYKEKNVKKETEEALKLVDHVITTTEYFAEQIKPLNTNVTVIPNCISPMDNQFVPRSISSPRMRFGWIGGVYHRADIASMDTAFCKVLGDKEVRDEVQICLGGFNHPNPEYQQIEQMMTCNYEFKATDSSYTEYLYNYTPISEHVSFDKPYRRLWAKSVFEYGTLYNEIDVSLIPLKDFKFNKCKSELKLVEAGWMGKAVIVQDVLPYSKWITHGKNGLLVQPGRPIDWYLNIKKLAKNPNMVKDLAEGLRETINEHFNMDKWNEVRAQLYKRIAG